MPRRSHKSRADCFFGIHLSYAPSADVLHRFARAGRGQIARLIDLARPDFIQWACKGPDGLVWYPDSESAASPQGLDVDLLKLVREVTAERGVSLYAGLAGLADRRACRQQPRWEAVCPGLADPGVASTFGHYGYERLNQQIMELLCRYHVEGVRLEHDCRAVCVDYSERAKEAFRELAGADQPPGGPGEAGWDAWMTLQRDQYFAYLKASLDQAHERDPECELASEGLYSSRVPEPMRAATDFLTADAGAGDVRLEARVLSNVGLPWDLTLDAQGRDGTAKPLERLEQEAAEALALGGSLAARFEIDGHGEPAEHQMRLAGHLGRFCHARQSICWKSETLPQIAVLLDSTSYLAEVPGVFGGADGALNPLRGVLDAVLEAGHAADVMAEHQFNWQQDHYPLVVLPEWSRIPVSLVEELTSYVRRGGSLLICGARTAGQFAEPLGVELQGEPREQTAHLQVPAELTRFGQGGAAQLSGLWQDVSLPGDAPARPVGHRTPGQHEAVGRSVAATLSPWGEGRIAAVYGPLGAGYLCSRSPLLRDWLDHLLRRLYRPLVTVAPDQAAGGLELVLRVRPGQTLIHLVNLRGMPACGEAAADGSAASCRLDRVPEVGPLRLHVRLAGRPGRVSLEPGGAPLSTRWDDDAGELTVSLPRLHIHSVVVIE